jgi:hypothetical protein
MKATAIRAAALALFRQRHTGGDRHVATLDAIAEELASAQMLAAAAAATDAAHATHQLGEQSFRVGKPREEMPVAAVAAEDDVLIAQMLDERDRDRFLPDISVRRAVQFTLRKQLENPGFELPDQDHTLIRLRNSDWSIRPPAKGLPGQIVGGHS